ncbi:hypothetical protein HDU67_001033 [Dinochytrium kinnereticum]|nr:hypothetical protein HDU67_001033 [Dinochytrium kinnereticum]
MLVCGIEQRLSNEFSGWGGEKRWHWGGSVDEDYGYSGMVLEAAKLLIATIFGVVAGQYIAIHGAAKLEEYDIFKYVPDDDDDDDDGDDDEDKKADDKAKAKDNEMKDIFGDFRLNMGYHWSTKDRKESLESPNVIELSKIRIAETLKNLQDMEKDGTVSGKAKEELALAVKYLKDHAKILEARIKEIGK